MSNSDQTPATQPPAVSDATHLVGLMLNDEKIIKYFHFTDSPERLPLPVVNVTKTELEGAMLLAGGQAVRMSAEPNMDALIVDHINITASQAEVGFQYGPEGIRGKVYFIRTTTGWDRSSVRIVEH